MARKSGYPYDKFMEYLEDEKSLSSITATTYASQCRRIIRSTGSNPLEWDEIIMISSDDVELFISGHSKKSQTPFRRSWRAFCAFLKLDKGIDLADASLIRGVELIPSIVAEAIKLLNDEEFPFRNLPSMRWEFYPNPNLRELFPDTYVILSPNKDKENHVLIPKFIMDCIKEWAYPETKITPDLWLIPREPNSQFPMPLSMLRRVAEITM